jgi:hypothetical protein
MGRGGARVCRQQGGRVAVWRGPVGGGEGDGLLGLELHGPHRVQAGDEAHLAALLLLRGEGAALGLAVIVHHLVVVHEEHAPAPPPVSIAPDIRAPQSLGPPLAQGPALPRPADWQLASVRGRDKGGEWQARSESESGSAFTSPSCPCWLPFYHAAREATGGGGSAPVAGGGAEGVNPGLLDVQVALHRRHEVPLRRGRDLLQRAPPHPQPPRQGAPMTLLSLSLPFVESMHKNAAPKRLTAKDAWQRAAAACCGVEQQRRPLRRSAQLGIRGRGAGRGRTSAKAAASKSRASTTASPLSSPVARNSSMLWYSGR